MDKLIQPSLCDLSNYLSGCKMVGMYMTFCREILNKSKKSPLQICCFVFDLFVSLKFSLQKFLYSFQRPCMPVPGKYIGLRLTEIFAFIQLLVNFHL